MFRFLYIPCFLLAVISVSAQISIHGRVVHRKTKESIPYANIGVAGSSIGTLSNTDGSFSVIIPKNLISDTLQVSALGFSRKIIPIVSLSGRKDVTIYLTEKAVVLSSITVSARKDKYKTFELGNRTVKGGVLETDTTYAGRSMALLIDNKEMKNGFTFPAYIQKARLKILKNNLASFKFRIRLNALDTITGKPGEDLLQQSIVIESSMRSGWLEFDLSGLNYQVTSPFFITFEQITDLADRTLVADGFRQLMGKHPEWLKTDTVMVEGNQEIRSTLVRGGLDLPGTFICIGGSPKRYSSYVRETSFAEWIKVNGILTATVTLSNQPLPNSKRAESLASETCDEASPECQITKWCNDFLDESGMPGMQLYVRQKGKERISIAIGSADMEKGVGVTDSTRFRINSISKSMTALALAKLASKGKIDLDANIQQYLPDFPEKKYPVTTRQLAGHLAGFRDYDERNPGDYIRTEHFDNSLSALRIVQNDTLLFKPGTQYWYSTFGWNVIGGIIESITHENYLAYMSKTIWVPMQLTNTCGDEVNTSIPNRSKFYDGTGNENDLGDFSYKYAGGGLLSTAKDLAKFGEAMLQIDPAIKKLLFDSQHTSDGKSTGYGLGWYTGKDRNGHRIWHHGGDSFSSSSFLLIYPDDDLVIAFLGNSQDGVLFDVKQIGELLYSSK